MFPRDSTTAVDDVDGVDEVADHPSTRGVWRYLVEICVHRRVAPRLHSLPVIENASLGTPSRVCDVCYVLSCHTRVKRYLS